MAGGIIIDIARRHAFVVQEASFNLAVDVAVGEDLESDLQAELLTLLDSVERVSYRITCRF